MLPLFQAEKLSFGLFEVDLRTEEIWRGSRKVRCQHQPFQVLRRLLEQPSEVVSRDELRRAIWGNNSPADADHSLGIAINKLREALGDSAESPRFIETLARRGYRFIAPVQPVTAADAPAVFLKSLEAFPSPQEVNAYPEAEPLQPGLTAVPASDNRLSASLIFYAVLLAAALLGGFLFGHFAPRPDPAPRRTEQVTRNDSIFPGVPQMESFTVLVSDGSRVYSSILDNGQTEIASIDPATGEMQQLQLPSEISNPTLSDISPDGTRLLVRSHNSFESEQPVWIVPRGGGSGLRVGNIRAQDAIWMPDGASILYALGNDLWLFRLTDSITEHFASLPGRAFSMRWSPDGTLLRFTLLDPLSHTSSLWQTERHGMKAGPARPLLTGWSTPPSECCGVWTRDGRSYIFQSGHNGGSDLWRMGGRSPGTPRQLTNGPLQYAAPLPADAGELYFVGLDTHSELEQLVDGKLAPEHDFLSGAWRVSYSRDRQWVAWTDSSGRLWRARAADGQEKIQLTPEDLQVFLAQWAPDGRRLLAMARRPGHSWQVYMVGAEGGTPEPLLPEERNEADPTWSSDGKTIAFGRTPDLMGRESGTKEIELLDLATRKVSAVPGSEGLFSPRWSPDGRWIAALTLGEQKLMLFDTRDGKWRAIPGVRASDPVWNPDSSALLVHDAFANPQNIRRIGIPEGSGTTVATFADTMDGNKADYVFVGATPQNAPLVRVRTATGNLFTLSLVR